MADMMSGKPSPQLCWTCRKACGGCSWSARFQPVPGWTAQHVEAITYHGSQQVRSESYDITACPEYVMDEPRRHTGP